MKIETMVMSDLGELFNFFRLIDSSQLCGLRDGDDFWLNMMLVSQCIELCLDLIGTNFAAFGG